MNISITARDLLDKGVWIDYCNKYGVNEWAIKEGLMNASQVLTISIEDAKNWNIV